MAGFLRSKVGAPETVIFEKLVDWTEHPEAEIRYYSGIATYRKTLIYGWKSKIASFFSIWEK